MYILLEKLDNYKISFYIDGRGKSVNFKSFSIHHLHIVTMNPGAIRGNHIHQQDEIVCVLGGCHICEIIVSHDDIDASQRYIVDDELMLYRIPGGIKHQFKNIGHSIFYLVVFTDKHI